MTNPAPCQVLLTQTTHRSVAFAHRYMTSQRKSPIPSAEHPWQPVLLRSLLMSWPTTDLSLNLSDQLHFLPLPPFNDEAWDTTELCTNSSGVGRLSSSNHLAMWEGQSHPGPCREVTVRVTTLRAGAPFTSPRSLWDHAGPVTDLMCLRDGAAITSKAAGRQHMQTLGSNSSRLAPASGAVKLSPHPN